jgi:urea carboxylase-associated protein 2
MAQKIDLDKLTPEEYRARYLALQEAARARAAAPVAAPSAGEIAEDAIVKRESLPAGAYLALRVRRGDALRIKNPAGTPGAALFLWNADDVSERYNAGDTVKLQWTTNFTAGRLLFSDMGRVLASITADSGAGHDSILGANGPAQALRNGRENLRLAAAKLGMTRRDVGQCISLFSSISTDDEGRFVYNGAPPAGAMVELRAEMNLLLAISNTPHVLSPVAEATGPIEICVYHAPAAGPDDPARNFSEEAVRGFINTDEVFAS